MNLQDATFLPSTRGTLRVLSVDALVPPTRTWRAVLYPPFGRSLARQAFVKGTRGVASKNLSEKVKQGTVALQKVNHGNRRKNTRLLWGLDEIEFYTMAISVY